MKERPILFSAAMIRAIMEETKTMTRRVVNRQNLTGAPISFRAYEIEDNNGDPSFGFSSDDESWVCPYGRPGDRLWVRETWVVDAMYDCVPPRELRGKQSVVYPATDIPWHTGKHRPSIHMPRWASRINLDITVVRVERLQNISETDAEKEGVDFLRYVPDADETLTAKQLFMCLWDSINGKRPGCSWDDNPWVWVVEFRQAV